jgi:hypothetical protein
MPAGAPYGNKNAEKWTRDSARKLFNDANELALSQDEKTGAYRYDFIGEIARDLGTFHHNFTHLVKRFPELADDHRRLKQTLEANCYFNSKKGNIREATAIVNLKSNHGWRDRNQIDTSINGDVNISPKQWRSSNADNNPE